MRIGVIGGLDRRERALADIARSAGHVAEFHHGRVGGRHAEDLEAIVERCDVSVIVTSVNSHGAVFIAKRAARRFGRRALIARTCGPSRFSLILSELARGGSTDELALVAVG